MALETRLSKLNPSLARAARFSLEVILWSKLMRPGQTPVVAVGASHRVGWSHWSIRGHQGDCARHRWGQGDSTALLGGGRHVATLPLPLHHHRILQHYRWGGGQMCVNVPLIESLPSRPASGQRLQRLPWTLSTSRSLLLPSCCKGCPSSRGFALENSARPAT